MKKRSHFAAEVAKAERKIILRALRNNRISRWNVAGAARTLGLPLSTLKYKIAKLNIARR